jgi:hypothetical protein
MLIPQRVGFRIRTSDRASVARAPADWAPSDAPARSGFAGEATGIGSGCFFCGNSKAMREAASPSTTSHPCPVIFDMPTRPPSGPPGAGLKTISPASASCSQTVSMRPGLTGPNRRNSCRIRTPIRCCCSSVHEALKEDALSSWHPITSLPSSCPRRARSSFRNRCLSGTSGSGR